MRPLKPHELNTHGCPIRLNETALVAELYLRHYDSENTCTEVAPGNDAEACIGLPATRRDTLVLTHSDAAAIAAQLPHRLTPAPGAGGLPVPR